MPDNDGTIASRRAMRSKRIWNRYLLPSLGYLAVTLISGLLIRYMWYSPGDVTLTISNLIHAHSRVALLGWVFQAL